MGRRRRRRRTAAIFLHAYLALLGGKGLVSEGGRRAPGHLSSFLSFLGRKKGRRKTCKRHFAWHGLEGQGGLGRGGRGWAEEGARHTHAPLCSPVRRKGLPASLIWEKGRNSLCSMPAAPPLSASAVLCFSLRRKRKGCLHTCAARASASSCLLLPAHLLSWPLLCLFLHWHCLFSSSSLSFASLYLFAYSSLLHCTSFSSCTPISSFTLSTQHLLLPASPLLPSPASYTLTCTATTSCTSLPHLSHPHLPPALFPQHLSCTSSLPSWKVKKEERLRREEGRRRRRAQAGVKEEEGEEEGRKEEGTCTILMPFIFNTHCRFLLHEAVFLSPVLHTAHMPGTPHCTFSAYLSSFLFCLLYALFLSHSSSSLTEERAGGEGWRRTRRHVRVKT